MSIHHAKRRTAAAVAVLVCLFGLLLGAAASAADSNGATAATKPGTTAGTAAGATGGTTAGTTGAANAAAPPHEMAPPTPTDAGFLQLKGLVGDWQAQSPDGKPVRASYKLTAAGSCIEETLDTPDGGEMVTVYHMDGSRLMMTHYCAAGNQPRMRCETPAHDPKTLSFAMFDATNLTAAEAMHMDKLTIHFDDPTHFTQEWNLRMGGKDTPTVFHFARMKS